ncbi:MAG: site-2 protease family protein [Bacteroidales bacterium]
MSKKYSLHLGRPFGIKVSVHWTFSLLIAWIVFVSVRQGLNTEQILMHIGFILTLFVCVVLHEFGHSLVAMKFGGEVKSITLLPIGGMANITKMPEKPKHEFLVSLSGPMVNIVIAAILWGYLAGYQNINFQEIDYQYITRSNFWVMLLAANLFIVAFNLIPAFPMDGGRLFRSALSVWMSRIKATRVAKNIGQVFAVLFIIAGLFGNPFLIIIGFVVYLGARGEYETIKYETILSDYKVRDVLISKYEELQPGNTLGEAAEKLQHIPSRGFVVKENGEFRGILTQHDLIKGLSDLGKEGKIETLVSNDGEKIKADMNIFDAFKTMHQKKMDMAPVWENNKFAGILDKENLNEFFLIKKAQQTSDD